MSPHDWLLGLEEFLSSETAPDSAIAVEEIHDLAWGKDVTAGWSADAPPDGLIEAAAFVMRFPDAVRTEALLRSRLEGLASALQAGSRQDEQHQLAGVRAGGQLHLPDAALDRPVALSWHAIAYGNSVALEEQSVVGWLAAVPQGVATPLEQLAAAGRVRQGRQSVRSRRAPAEDISAHINQLRQMLRYGAREEARRFFLEKSGLLLADVRWRQTSHVLATRLDADPPGLVFDERLARALRRELARMPDSARASVNPGNQATGQETAARLEQLVRVAAQQFLAHARAPDIWLAVVAHFPFAERFRDLGAASGSAVALVSKARANPGFWSLSGIERARVSIEVFRSGALQAPIAARRLRITGHRRPVLVDSELGRALYEPGLTDRLDPALVWAAQMTVFIARRVGVGPLEPVYSALRSVLLDELPLWLATSALLGPRRVTIEEPGPTWFARALDPAWNGQIAREIACPAPHFVVLASDAKLMRRLAPALVGQGVWSACTVGIDQWIAVDGVAWPIAQAVRQARAVICDLPGVALACAMQGQNTFLLLMPDTEKVVEREARRLPMVANLRIIAFETVHIFADRRDEG